MATLTLTTTMCLTFLLILIVLSFRCSGWSDEVQTFAGTAALAGTAMLADGLAGWARRWPSCLESALPRN